MAYKVWLLSNMIGSALAIYPTILMVAKMIYIEFDYLFKYL